MAQTNTVEHVPEKDGTSACKTAKAASKTRKANPPKAADTTAKDASPDTTAKDDSPGTTAKKPRKKRNTHNKDLGARGEEAAAQYLYKRGYEIEYRNWTCPAGEADIIARDENALVFVEVKTRTGCEKGLPEEAVNERKRRRYENIAATYLAQNDVVDMQVRFDIVSILVVAEDRALIRHHINAFAAG